MIFHSSFRNINVYTNLKCLELIIGWNSHFFRCNCSSRAWKFLATPLTPSKYIRLLSVSSYSIILTLAFPWNSEFSSKTTLHVNYFSPIASSTHTFHENFSRPKFTSFWHYFISSPPHDVTNDGAYDVDKFCIKFNLNFRLCLVSMCSCC